MLSRGWKLLFTIFFLIILILSEEEFSLQSKGDWCKTSYDTSSVGGPLFFFPFPTWKYVWALQVGSSQQLKFVMFRKLNPMIAFILNSWLLKKPAEILNLLLITFLFKSRTILLVGERKTCGQTSLFFNYIVLQWLQGTGSRRSCDL